MKKYKFLRILPSLFLLLAAGCQTTTTSDSSTSTSTSSSTSSPDAVTSDSSSGETTSSSEESTSTSTTPVHTHTLEKVEAVEPTCTEEGHSEYWQCTGCGKIFADEAGTTETDLDSLTIAALGHDYSAEEDNYTQLVCSRCSHHGRIYELENTICNGFTGYGGAYDDKIWKLAAAQRAGTSGDYYLGNVNDVSLDGSGTQGMIYFEWGMTAAEAETGTFSLKACLGTDYIYKSAFKLEVNGTEVTVGEDEKLYKDTSVDAWTTWELFEYASVSLVQGYNSFKLTIMKNATCDLDYAFVETASRMADHAVVEVPASEATCTETGSTGYYYCQECGKAFSDAAATTEVTLDSVTIAALGHDYVADTTDDTERECSRCHHHGKIYDLENVTCNGYNGFGGDYNDKIWKIAATSDQTNVYGTYYIGQVSDVSANESYVDKIYFEWTVNASVAETATLSLNIAIPVDTILKSAFKLEVNSTEITTSGSFTSVSKSWNAFDLLPFADIPLIAGANTIRMTIEAGATCNLDYAFLETVNQLEQA